MTAPYVKAVQRMHIRGAAINREDTAMRNGYIKIIAGLLCSAGFIIASPFGAAYAGVENIRPASDWIYIDPGGSNEESLKPSTVSDGRQDADEDGVPDSDDNCVSTPNSDQLDLPDGDRIGNACDLDDDDDGIRDSRDPDDDNDGTLDGVDDCEGIADSGQDVDNDGQDDACDPDFVDSDGDGVPDRDDNCPNTHNPDQAPSPIEPGVGDLCDGDSDNDGVPDGNDNCANAFNPSQEDVDGDAAGNACDRFVSIGGLFNTGVDDSRIVLPGSSPEQHYVLTQQPPSTPTPPIVTAPNALWANPPEGSAWISPFSSAQSAPLGTYVYTFTFDLKDLGPNTASFLGRVAADNSLAVFLNGAATGFNLPDDGFRQLNRFEISQGFVSGINTLEFRVENAAPTDGLNPTGLLVANLRGEAQDATPPECEIVEHVEGSHIRVRVQDRTRGLAAIGIITARNAEVTGNAVATPTSPGFSPGTNEAVIVTATKVDPGAASMLVMEVRDVAGNARQCDPVLTTLAAEVPESFSLGQNYPNPFNPSTTIHFQVTESGRVQLEIYNVLGRRITTLVDDQMESGSYAAEWDGRDSAGQAVAGGTYLYRLRAGGLTESKVMTLLK